MNLFDRIAAHEQCQNDHCDRPPAFVGVQYCEPCFQGLKLTGRLPIIEAVFIPAWRKRNLARDESRRAS